MDKYEAKLAVDLNAICVSGGIRYYAYGMEYINPIDKPAYESIILHDLRANSITRADRERTTVEDWKAPPEYVEKRRSRGVMLRGSSRMKQTTYKTEFISKAPCSMENGVLYIAPHANLSMHKCMCGCGETVIAPIDENSGRERGFWGWTYDGKNASLHPSVGNYKQACKSHYFLTNGKVQWC